jgi:WXG100 family type VII secretion target
MAATQKATFAELDAAVTDFNNTITEVEGVGQSISGQMMALNQSWTGSAGASYQDAYLAWKKGYDITHDNLQVLATTLKNAADVQQALEDKLAAANAG